jgi:hypothetical protein
MPRTAFILFNRLLGNRIEDVGVVPLGKSLTDSTDHWVNLFL